jgi:uncharacterized metal-binding protein YceD (DUF177 family)
VSSPRLVVSVSDLDNGPKEASFTLPLAWLKEVLEPGGATPGGDGTLTVELTKQGQDVMVRGRATLAVTMPCVVTLEPVPFDLRPEIFLMLKPGKAPAPAKRPPKAAAPKAETKAEQQAPKRKKRPGARDLEPELSSQDGAPDTFVGDEIVLDEFVREFLLLELPLYPRRPDLPSAEESLVSRPLAGPTGEKPIDPRLEPLAKLAARLRGAANKE